MLIDRTHRTWFFVSVIIMAVASVGYVVYAQSTPKGASGGSLIGLLYGVVGTAMMLFAGLLAARKKVSFWRLGSAKFWLRGHLWLGALSFPMILFHAGFEWGGRLEQTLWILFGVVMLSGFFGLLMQNILPKLLSSRIPLETMRAQIPYIRKRNRIISDRLVSTSCGPIPLEGDPLVPQLTKLAKHAANFIELEETAKTKEEKDQARDAKNQWIDQVDKDDVGLYMDIAGVAKEEWGARTVNDFTPLLLEIYTIAGVNDQPKATAKPVATEADAKPEVKPDATTEAPEKPAPKKAGGSPLDQMKAKAAAPKADDGADKPLSPLEQMKAKQAAAGDKPLSPLEQMKAKQAAAAGDKPLSPLEQMKAKQAAAAGAAAANKPLSPLEQAKAAGAKKPAAEGGAPKLSPLEMARQAGAAGAKKEQPAADDAPKLSPLEVARKAGAKGAGAAKTPVSEGDTRKLSPLEMARAAGAAGAKAKQLDDANVVPTDSTDKGDSSAAATPDVDVSKLSPLERARLAGAKGGSKKAAMASAAPAESVPLKQVGAAPAASPMVVGELASPKSQVPTSKPAASTKSIQKPNPTPAKVADINIEVAAIQKLLTEKYSYAGADAKTYAESTRSFLKTDPAVLQARAAAEVRSIASLLTEAYGYESELASEIAELTRPFVDGSAAEKAAAKAAAVAAAKEAKSAPKPAAEAAATEDAVETSSEVAVTAQSVAASDKPLSPLEAARKAGAKGGPKTQAADKPLSPLEAARQAGAAGGAKPKPVSPLEAARQAGAAGGAKPKAASPLDAVRSAGAAKAKPAPAGGGSPLDQMKAKAAASKEASDKPATAAAATAERAAPTKPAVATPAPVKKPPVAKKKASKKKAPVLRTDELRRFYIDQLRPYLVSDGKSGRLADTTEANRAFTAMRATLPVELHETLGELREHCDEHRQFAEQQRIHNWLHYWLALHIPFSIALYVLAAVHIVVALRVIPWELPKLW